MLTWLNIARHILDMSLLFRVHRALLRCELAVLVLLFLSLVVMAFAQIMMRNFFTSGIIWAESYVRIVVLWLAMFGAMLASRFDEHIAIDLMAKKLPVTLTGYAKRLTNLFSSAVCLIMAWHSLGFVMDEYSYGGTAFANVPNWLCEAVIPFAFLIIGLRYFLALWMAQKSRLAEK